MTMETEPLKIALAQMNAVVGDIAGNTDKIRSLISRARDEGAALVLFPELAVTGYPPEDLLLKTHFVDAAGAALAEIAREVEDIVALVGFPQRADDVYNAVGVLADGAVAAVYRKMFLPNYGVFDEQRYFQAGVEPALIELNGVAVGLTICEDIWDPGPPATAEALAGAQLIVNVSASPYHAGKPLEREQMLVQRARDNLAIVAFCNLVGGQDELVFDGHSVVIDDSGAVLARAPQFEESLTLCTVDPGAVASARLRDARHRAAVRRERELERPTLAPLRRLAVPATDDDVGGTLAEPLGPEQEIYQALVTGVRDYVDKNGFKRVVLGLSGGIDSSLVALIAVDALGADRVVTVVMPSPYSSDETQHDARTLAANLGTELVDLDISHPMQAYDTVLHDMFRDRDPDITEENLQARIRGNLVMALSNKFGWLVLTTGNKSEMSVGYATLYGDMAGGFAVLKDVYKGWVYRLAAWRNERAGGALIPPDILTRPPSAELRYEQRDDETLPPYEVLDAILHGYVEEDLDAEQLAHQGLPADEVERIIQMVDRAEYKRRQAPPGVKISTRAFGRDRRLPITNRSRAWTHAALGVPKSSS
jgi:NAD+ synthase (glutamine-hydrolysing)